jgi:hypothetical protein
LFIEELAVLLQKVESKKSSMSNNKLLLSLFVLVLCQTSVFSQKSQLLNGFNQIELFGKLEIRLEEHSKDSIAIESGSFDVEKINYSVKDSLLSIKLTTEFPSSIQVRITVYYKNIRSINAGGGIKLYNKGVLNNAHLSITAKSGSDFDLEISADSALVKVNKGAFVRLSGTSRVINLSSSTGGDYRAVELENEDTYAKMSGGTAEVAPTKLLNGDVSYGASLKYKDEPATIKRAERLGGTITQLEDF